MAELKCLNSSSAGNCFILKCGNERLLLDLGVEWKKILKALGYCIRDIVGCLSTHIHTDHSKAIPQALHYCLDVYSCQQVSEKYEGVITLPIGRKTNIGGFTVQPIPLKHNVENYGYIITHKDLGKLVFALDCEEFLYKIKDVNHWIIEANHSFDVMFDNAMSNEYSASHSENHLSIEQCIDTLTENQTTALSTVVLAHLSDANSNAKDFQRMVKDSLGIERVFIADNTLDIELTARNNV